MQKTIDVLVEKAHEYMQLMTTFNCMQHTRHQNAIAKALKYGVVHNGLHPEVRRDLGEIDSNSEEVPVTLAGDLLDSTIYGSQEIQGMLDRVSEFREYDTVTFRDYGIFISVMIAHTLNKEEEMVLYTRNNADVYVPDFYMNCDGTKETSYPWKMKYLCAHERDKLLIAHLGSRLKHGRLVVCGNVGRFFAYKNSGADVELNGECGWRPCYNMSDGRVTINGIAGHDIGTYAYGGQIFVNGIIRNIADTYTEVHKYEIFHNRTLVPKVNEKIGKLENS